MLQYERLDISEGMDFDKTTKSLECMICHYWYFTDFCFKYQPFVCNGCHDFSMIVQNLDDFLVLNIKSVNYRCCVGNLIKKDAISLLKNSVLDNKVVL